MKQKKKKGKDKSRQRKRKRSQQQQKQTKQFDKIELQQSDRRKQKRARQQNRKQSKKDSNKDRKKVSLIQLQGQQLSVQDFRQLVNNVSKRYDGEAVNLVLDEKYWQKQKQRQELRELRELNRKIKQQLIETNRLQLQQLQEKDTYKQQKKIDLAFNHIKQSDNNNKIPLQKNDNNGNSTERDTFLNNGDNKVKIQSQISQQQLNKTKQQQQSQYLDQLFLETQSQKDQLDIQQQVINNEEQLLKKGLKTKHKKKQYLLTLMHQHHKPFSKLTITDLQGTFWQLKINLEFFTQLKSSLNLTSNLKTFIQYFVKSIQTNSNLKQIDKINQQTIQNLIMVQINLSIGQGLLMNCTVQVPRYLSLNQMLMSKKEKQKLIDKKEKRRQYDKLMRKFILGMYECKQKQLQNQRLKWEHLSNMVSQKITQSKQAKLSNKENLTNNKSSKSNGTQSGGNKKSNPSQIPQNNQSALIQPDKIRQMITNTIMLSLQNPNYNGPTQNFDVYNMPGAFNNNDTDYDKTKHINKKYKTDLMNPNRIRRKKQKGVKLFE